MKQINKFLQIVGIYSKNSIKQRSNLIVGTITMFARCAITLILYSYAYQVNNGVINNSTFTESAWSMFLYFSFMMLSIRRIFRSIERDIATGSIEIFITKPINYLRYNFVKKIGEDLVIFLLVTAVGSIFMIFLVGIPASFSLFTILSIIVTLTLGIILGSLFYSIIGMAAFFFQRVDAFNGVLDKLVMILGGSYLPIALFPEIMKNFATYSPFGAINFVTSTVYANWKNEYLIKIFMQLFWIGILSLVLWFVFKKAKERLAVNGG